MKKPLLVHRLKIGQRNFTGPSILEHVRWCRKTLGERDVDWDFTGGATVEIIIYTQPAATFYMLQFPDAVVQK